jgi:hypothetical protein
VGHVGHRPASDLSLWGAFIRSGALASARAARSRSKPTLACSPRVPSGAGNDRPRESGRPPRSKARSSFGTPQVQRPAFLLKTLDPFLLSRRHAPQSSHPQSPGVRHRPERRGTIKANRWPEPSSIARKRWTASGRIASRETAETPMTARDSRLYAQRLLCGQSRVPRGPRPSLKLSTTLDPKLDPNGRCHVSANPQKARKHWLLCSRGDRI